MNKLKILAISGSLKLRSSNTSLLRAMVNFDHPRAEINIYGGLELFPQFSPDNEQGNDTVRNFRKSLANADGVIICTPEYAFGVPGSLKNALDYTVSTGDLNEKPVIGISASPMYEGGAKALASLLLTLSALGAKMDPSLSLSVANVSKKLDEKGELIDELTRQKLRSLLDGLVTMIGNDPKKN